MDPETLTIVLAVGILVVVGLGLALLFSRRRRSEELRQRFGPEYDHTVNQLGDRRKAEEELQARQKRVEALDIRALLPDEREQFLIEWKSVQAQFVDRPSQAVQEANRLVKEVMMARGFPVSDFEHRAADVSVYHPNLVTDYRAAHDIAEGNKRGEADTEELRQAMAHYRSLFEELLETREREIKERT